MQKNIAVILGDGIGPEVTQQALRVLNAVAERYDHDFNYRFCSMGAEAIDRYGVPLPEETVEVCLNSDAILFGAIGHPKYDNDPMAKVRPEQGLFQLRQRLQLFANIRPISNYPSLNHLSPLRDKVLEGVDLIIFREITGGIYFGEKSINDEGTYATETCSYSKDQIERIAHLAFKAAQQRRKKLTLLDKSNVLVTSKLWRKVVLDIAPQYPDVELNCLYIDNAGMQLIVHPKQFDVVLTENMFGDILSEFASVISGSVGLLPSTSMGEKTALFEPIHGSYPQAAGKDIANPVGSILSAALMLEYFDLKEEAKLVREAVEWTIKNVFVTKDIDPINFYFTSTIGEMISDYVSGRISGDINQKNVELRKSTII